MQDRSKLRFGFPPCMRPRTTLLRTQHKPSQLRPPLLKSLVRRPTIHRRHPIDWDSTFSSERRKRSTDPTTVTTVTTNPKNPQGRPNLVLHHPGQLHPFQLGKTQKSIIRPAKNAKLVSRPERSVDKGENPRQRIRLHSMESFPSLGFKDASIDEGAGEMLLMVAGGGRGGGGGGR